MLKSGKLINLLRYPRPLFLIYIYIIKSLYLAQIPSNVSIPPHMAHNRRPFTPLTSHQKFSPHNYQNALHHISMNHTRGQWPTTAHGPKLMISCEIYNGTFVVSGKFRDIYEEDTIYLHPRALFEAATPIQILPSPIAAAPQLLSPLWSLLFYRRSDTSTDGRSKVIRGSAFFDRRRIPSLSAMPNPDLTSTFHPPLCQFHLLRGDDLTIMP